VALTGAVGWGWQEALEAFVVTNSLMGFAFGVCGAVIAWHRPANPIGWLFAADGLGHATSALMAPLAQVMLDAAAPVGALRLVMTVFMWSWPWSIGLFLPVALLLFPDGRLPSPRWRPVLWGVVVTAPLFVLEMATGPEPVGQGIPVGYLTLPWYDALSPLWMLSEVRTFAALVLACVALVVRYRTGAETQRRQLLWLLLATITAVVAILPWSFVAGTPIVVLFAIPLIPVAVTVAVVRHQLLDIRLVVSRAVAWLLLSLAVVAAYVALVAALDTFVSAQLGRSALATVVIALLVAPLLPRLQRLVDRAMYGDRSDPARVASRVGAELLAGPEGGLPGVASAVRRALRLPYVAVSSVDGRVLATDGAPPDGPVRAVALDYGGESVGELRVGLRPGERELSAADRAALGLVAAPLAVAVHATSLSGQLQESRERIVSAREEERRRLRRDLHDGMGPTLTGVALTADAATNLIESDPVRSRELLAALRTDVRQAIADIRRLVENLRPPALDELGLVGALRQRAEQLAWRAEGGGIGVRLDTPDQLPTLPAAIEVAAYRIATEALTNVVRHSGASTAVLRLRCDDTLDVEVVDDGPPNGEWRAGMGLQAMRERAAELGGSFESGPSDTGGRVHVSLPLAAS
jgi:signal transduction histidine kinase